MIDVTDISLVSLLHLMMEAVIHRGLFFQNMNPLQSEEMKAFVAPFIKHVGKRWHCKFGDTFEMMEAKFTPQQRYRWMVKMDHELLAIRCPSIGSNVMWAYSAPKVARLAFAFAQGEITLRSFCRRTTSHYEEAQRHTTSTANCLLLKGVSHLPLDGNGKLRHEYIDEALAGVMKNCLYWAVPWPEPFYTAFVKNFVIQMSVSATGNILLCVSLF